MFFTYLGNILLMFSLHFANALAIENRSFTVFNIALNIQKLLHQRATFEDIITSSVVFILTLRLIVIDYTHRLVNPT